MKLFDRLIIFNTFIVGLVFVTALINPSAQMPSVGLPDGPAVNISTAFPKMPSFPFSSDEFHSAEPQIAGAFANEGETAPTKIPTPSATPTPTPIPIADPVKIDIPRLQVSTHIVKVGLSESNEMEIPQDFASVGWYFPSGKPGENGSAILNGHFDDVSGNPAAFFNLKNLKIDDEIIITAQDNKQYVFRVEDVYSHPLEAFPHDLLYADPEGQHLKLLTCDGVWDTVTRNYSNRLVVVANLAEIR